MPQCKAILFVLIVKMQELRLLIIAAAQRSQATFIHGFFKSILSFFKTLYNKKNV